MSVDWVFRIMGLVVAGFGGWRLGDFAAQKSSALDPLVWGISLTLLGAVIGLGVTPYLTIRPLRWAKNRIKVMPVSLLLETAAGLVVGLIIAALLALPLSMLPGLWGDILPVVVTLGLGYLGVAVAAMRGRELGQLISSYLPGPILAAQRTASGNGKVVVDTSAIIDGRIADISQTGFIQGTLVIPRFVLDELRHIADSPDPLRRNRGRRGLDMLNKLQKESDVPVQIPEIDFDDVPEVDAKLVRLAKTLRCPIITNDFNLNRVAELQGVRALNINELTNAVKSVVLPGEEMEIRIIQEGREVGQGVGFLDDGTMVVVEGGKRYLNNKLTIIVTRVLQTVAGRMIFAQPKPA